MSKIPKLNFRTSPRVPSKPDSDFVAVKKEVKEYTGTNMIGIATMHKSNAVPVFSDQAAKDISNMRR